jgi:hypothetical protein
VTCAISLERASGELAEVIMGSVADEVEAEIERLRVASIAPGLTQLARKLAEGIDGAENLSAIAKGSTELRAALTELRKLAPVAAEVDRVDELAKKREDGRIRARRA